MNCFRGSSDILWVVLPYFNYCKFEKRRQLFIEFVNKIHNEPNVKIIIVESSSLSPLPKLPVYKHICVTTLHYIWVKENLINLGIESLPKGWEYVAWIDADVEFLNKNWIDETIRQLKSNDVVQLFKTAVNLGPNGEALKIDKGFAYMYKGSGTPWVQNDKYGFWHPGYGWACTKRAWIQMDGLLDWAILGSGDRHMAMAWAGRVIQSCPGNINENYKKLLIEYQKLCKGFKVSWVDGTILHYWHGSFENRRYRERWDILIKNNFDPFRDVGISKNGQIFLTTDGQRLELFLLEYFSGRKEDS